MRSNNKFYIFFIIIALLFWNPVSYYLFYSNTPIYSIKAIHIFYWIIFVSGTISAILIQKNVFNDKIKNVVLTVALIGILFSVFVIVDRLAGLVSKNGPAPAQNQEWLIFEPNVKARHKTVEFDYIANINSLGLRDREIDIDKGNKFRILCFGDSWTFGYGVNIEESWPKVLERYLLTNGIENIEVVNCGRPGQFTGTYRKYMEEIVPLLKPDLVLVGVLQLDDLAQIYTHNFRINQSSKIETFFRKGKSVIIRYIKYSFKNIISPSNTIDIASSIKKTSDKRINEFKFWQKLRFSTLNDSVQSLFKSGNLESGLLDNYINYPDRVIIFNNPDHPVTKFSIKEMSKDLKKMKDICHNYGSTLVFINIPMNYFTGHKVIRTSSDILNSYFEINNNIDPIYRSIAQANDLTYIELTNHFIGLQNKSAYLFKYDGHPNEKGNEEIAKYIGKQLIENGYTIHK